MTAMIRSPIAITCCVTLMAATLAEAQETKEKAASDNVRELVVNVRAVDQPLMKYRLLPAENELHDGNAAPILLRLPWDQTPYFSKVVPTFREYLDLPLDDPKVLDSGDLLSPRLYSEMKRAAYRRTAEWEYPIGEEPAAGILLPDVQGAREIVARGLSVWIRYHIAHDNIEKAHEGIVVGLANTRHYGRTPFIIIQLVCAAYDNMMLGCLEELLSRSDCPNMYWALTSLPRPMIDLRPSIELEQTFLDSHVEGIRSLPDSATEQQWFTQAREIMQMFLESGGGQQTQNFNAQQVLARMAARGRQELPKLIDGGLHRVAGMSDAEVALRWFLHVHAEQSQKTAALMSLEPPAAIPRLKELQQELANFRKELGVPTLFLLEHPLNAYVVTQGIERRIDALRVVEAIRNYAANHDSQLPTSLDQIVDTPIPNDPFTGEPFHYEVHDDAALLSGEVIESQPGKEMAAIRYRIKLRNAEAN